MRTERRHELHHNVLADWLGVQIERLRPYSRVATAVVLGALVFGGVWMYIQSQSAATQDQQWTDYFQAMDSIRFLNKPEPLIEIAQASEYQQTPAGYWAASGLGDYYLREGVNQLFSNRPAAAEALRSALRTYAQVTQQSKYPMLAQRALLGMGVAHEGLNELDDARKSYDKILTTWPGSSYEISAKQRLAQLDRKSTPQFYDWFFATSLPRGGVFGPGTPGARPNFGEMPTEGTFLPPKGDESPAGATPEPGIPPINSPAIVPPGTEPPDEPPASDKAATEPPATETKSAAPPAEPSAGTFPPSEAPRS